MCKRVRKDLDVLGFCCGAGIAKRGTSPAGHRRPMSPRRAAPRELLLCRYFLAGPLSSGVSYLSGLPTVLSANRSRDWGRGWQGLGLRAWKPRRGVSGPEAFKGDVYAPKPPCRETASPSPSSRPTTSCSLRVHQSIRCSRATNRRPATVQASHPRSVAERPRSVVPAVPAPTWSPAWRRR